MVNGADGTALPGLQQPLAICSCQSPFLNDKDGVLEELAIFCGTIEVKSGLSVGATCAEGRRAVPGVRGCCQ